jgi:hypothetical protein
MYHLRNIETGQQSTRSWADPHEALRDAARRNRVEGFDEGQGWAVYGSRKGGAVYRVRLVQAEGQPASIEPASDRDAAIAERAEA